MQWELHKRLRITLAGIWLVLTFSLCAWWMVLGLGQAQLLSSFHQVTEHAVRQQRMIIWEGSFLLLFVMVGGALIFKSIYRDQKRNEQMRSFFSTFTHELKTSLTSIRLQAEILEEDPRNRENENLRRLLRDVVRLELQLENALVLAQAERSRLFLEEISLKKLISSLSVHWPQLKILLDQDAYVLADQRALECVLKNLFQNAFVHGKATELKVSLQAREDQLTIRVADNGQGFSGDLSKLGVAFVRHTTRSGSGVGLYLSRLLASRMNGSLEFERNEGPGLCALLKIKGRLA